MRLWASSIVLVLLVVAGCERPKDEALSGPNDRQEEKVTELEPKAEVPPEKQPGKDDQQKPPDETPGEYDRTASAPVPKEKWDFALAEKTWGIKLKRIKYVVTVPEVSGSGYARRSGEYLLLLEFTRDLTGPELTSVKGAGGTTSAGEFVVLDEDSVPVRRLYWKFVSPETLTGVKGDAFWLRYGDREVHGYGQEDAVRIKRVELRPKKQ